MTALLSAGCSQTRHDWAITDASVALPPMNLASHPLDRAGAPPEPLALGSGGGQLVLIHCLTSADAYYEYRRWGRSFVIVLDAAAKGRIEITPDNGRFIEHADWAPARAPYQGLEGGVTIISTSSSAVVADCAVRNIIRRTGDPVYSLRGLCTFRVSGVDTAELERCGVLAGTAR